MTTTAPQPDDRKPTTPLDDFNPIEPIGQVYKPKGAYSPLIEVARIRAYGETLRFYHRCMVLGTTEGTHLALVLYSRQWAQGVNVSDRYLAGALDAAEFGGLGFETATDYLRRGSGILGDCLYPTPLLIAMSRAACAADESEDGA